MFFQQALTPSIETGRQFVHIIHRLVAEDPERDSGTTPAVAAAKWNRFPADRSRLHSQASIVAKRMFALLELQVWRGISIQRETLAPPEPEMAGCPDHCGVFRAH